MYVKQTEKKRSLFLLLFLIIAGILGLLITDTTVFADSIFSGISETDVLDGHIHAKLDYKKEGSSSYTAVGDIVTVTTTLVKNDEGVLPEEFKDSILISLFPDEKQGLQLLGEPELTYTHLGLKEKGKLMDPELKEAKNVMMLYNFFFSMQGLPSYDGRITQATSDGSADDTYSIRNALVNKGDTFTITYKAKVTEAALKNEKFELHAVVSDPTSDIDPNDFLTAEMPSIQAIGVSFDAQSREKDIDSQQIVLTGNWTGPVGGFKAKLIINADIEKTITVSPDNFKDNGTFSIPIDLSEIKSMGNIYNVILFIEDNNGQTAKDTATLTVTKQLVPPVIELDNDIVNQPVHVYPTDESFTFSGKWKDDDSSKVSLYYKLNGVEKPIKENIANAIPGTYYNFSHEIETSALAEGENKIEVYAKDSEGQTSNIASFTAILEVGTVRFSSIPDILDFSGVSLSANIVHSKLTQALNLFIEDTTGQPVDWKLNVRQLEDFKDGDKILPATLSYENNGSAQLLSKNEAVTLPVTKSDASNYTILQDQQNFFDMTIQPGAYTGEYSTKLEWTIVNAP